MDYDSIEAAYKPFVSELRAGGFQIPQDGWSSELVAAHVALGNELIAEVAELVVAGQYPHFTNDAAVDEAQLISYIRRAGGLSGLALAVEKSAERLAAASEALGQKAVDYMLPARIVDSGTVVRDASIPIGEFIDGNITVHLDNHLEQLRRLRS